MRQQAPGNFLTVLLTLLTCAASSQSGAVDLTFLGRVPALATTLPNATAFGNGSFYYLAYPELFLNPLAGSKLVVKDPSAPWISVNPFTGAFSGQVPEMLYGMAPQQISFLVSNGACSPEGSVVWNSVSFMLALPKNASNISAPSTPKVKPRNYALIETNQTIAASLFSEYLDFSSQFLRSHFVGVLSSVDYPELTSKMSVPLYEFVLPRGLFYSVADKNLTSLEVRLSDLFGNPLPEWMLTSETNNWSFTQQDFVIGGFPKLNATSFTLRIDLFQSGWESRRQTILANVDLTQGRDVLKVDYASLDRNIYVSYTNDSWSIDIPDSLFLENGIPTASPVQLQVLNGNSNLTYDDSLRMLSGTSNGKLESSETFALVSADVASFAFYEGVIHLKPASTKLGPLGPFVGGFNPLGLDQFSIVVASIGLLVILFLIFLLGFLFYRRESKQQHKERQLLRQLRSNGGPLKLEPEPEYFLDYLGYVSQCGCIFDTIYYAFNPKARRRKHVLVDSSIIDRRRTRPPSAADVASETAVVIQMDAIHDSGAATMVDVPLYDETVDMSWEQSLEDMYTQNWEDMQRAANSEILVLKAKVGKAFHFNYPVEKMLNALGLEVIAQDSRTASQFSSHSPSKRSTSGSNNPFEADLPKVQLRYSSLALDPGDDRTITPPAKFTAPGKFETFRSAVTASMIPEDCPVRFSVRLYPSGAPLPKWLHFNPRKCSFFGIPYVFDKSCWEIEIVAYMTDDGHRSTRLVSSTASEIFTLEIGESFEH